MKMDWIYAEMPYLTPTKNESWSSMFARWKSCQDADTIR